MKTDEELVFLAQSGNSDAELELFSRYKNLLRKSSRSYFLIGGEYEDLMQESMIGLYKAIKYFSSTRNIKFSSFADLCIKRQIQTAMKKATSQKSLILSTALPLSIENNFDDDEDENIEFAIPSSDPSPDEILISKETIKEIIQIINKKLSKMELSVLSKYLNGLSYNEISQNTGLSKKSIDNALTRIKRKLEFLKK